MKVGVLTSSRADFGIYTPLLKKIAKDDFFEMEIIAFGTHLSKKHGYTIEEIKNNFSETIKLVECTMRDGDAFDISLSAGETHIAFSQFWRQSNYDLVLCLGDRYEMSAAVQASIPFGIQLAHFHGGEKTLGAFDNIYRHQITLASRYHFTATDDFAKRVKELLDENSDNIFAVGSMSLSDLNEIPIISLQELRDIYQLPSKPYILCTFHPETIDDRNNYFADEMIDAFRQIPESHHIILSMPNADTNGIVYRERLAQFKQENPGRITLVESFGKINYFSAMQHTEFLLGNSSSGIIEAASFKKHVINVGKRQAGRLQSGNCINVDFSSQKIIDAIQTLINNPATFSGENKYVKEDTIAQIVSVLRSIGNGEL